LSRPTRRITARRSGAALVLASALLAAPVRAEETESAEAETGIQIAAGLATLVYAPVKALYAVGGGVTAGMAYVVSAGDRDVTEPILTPSLRGDYIVRPEHLRGEKTLEFFGRPPAAEEEPPAVASGDGLDESEHARSSESDEPVHFE
jgi:hypothetical protein